MISHNCLNKKNRYNYFCQWKISHVGIGSRTRVNLYIVSCWKLFVCVFVDEMTIFPFRFPHKHFNSTSHQKYPQSRRITYGKNIFCWWSFISLNLKFPFPIHNFPGFGFFLLFFLKDFSVDVILRQRWTDRRLKFNHSTVGVLELDQKMTEKVWVPDSFFPKEKRAQIHEVTVPNRLLHIYSNGTVFYSMR